jgi:hypothetical protein
MAGALVVKSFKALWKDINKATALLLLICLATEKVVMSMEV